MAARLPLVLGADALPQQLQAGDSLAGAAGTGVIAGTATITLPNTGGGVMEWSESFAAANVTPASRLFLALGTTTDADENDPEFLVVDSIQGMPGAGTITADLTFGEPTSGPIILNWSAM